MVYHCSTVEIDTKYLLPACILENSGSEKLLDVTIDKKLNFNEHVTNLCDKKKCRKSQVLARSVPNIPQNTKTTFNECLFYVSIWFLFSVWMSYSTTLKKYVNSI